MSPNTSISSKDLIVVSHTNYPIVQLNLESALRVHVARLSGRPLPLDLVPPLVRECMEKPELSLIQSILFAHILKCRTLELHA
jgi:hypothetical protein